MRFSTRPRHILDVLLWPIVRIVWERLLGSRKISHFWMWRSYTGPMPGSYVEPREDSAADPITGWFTNFYNVNFGWQKVAVLEAREPQPLQIGIVSSVKRRYKGPNLWCTLIIEPGQQFAVLIGPERTKFFAQKPVSGEFVPLKIVGYTRRLYLHPQIPLL
jgi:hypothetical protein